MKEETFEGHLFNLIIYTEDELRLHYFEEVVNTLVQRFPCRVIFAKIDQKSPMGVLKTEQIDGSSQGGVCETFVAIASKDQYENIPFIVLPLLIADLPTYVVWGEDPSSDHPVLMEMQKFANRLVYDSSKAKSLHYFAQKMLSKIDNFKSDFMDVDWANISGWRDVFFSTFHSTEKLNHLKNANAITIKYNSSDTPYFKNCLTQALYFQTWIAAQLGWKFQELSENTTVLKYTKDSKLITLTLVGQERKELPPGSLFEVEVCAPDQIKYTLSLAEKQSKVFVYYSTATHCELPHSLPIRNLKKGLSFMKEIFYFRTSEHYRNMLSYLKNLPRL